MTQHPKPLAHRYAVAIYHAAKKHKHATATICQELTLWAETIQKNNMLRDALQNPRIYTSLFLKQWMKKIKQNFHPIIYQLIELLIQNKRIYLFTDIQNQYYCYYMQKEGRQYATLTSATSITKEEQAQWDQYLMHYTKKKDIEWKEVVDPTLIGGYKITFNNQMLDFTFKRKIERIYQSWTKEK